MTPAEAASRITKYRLTLVKNVLDAMDQWGILTVRHVVEQRMQRKGLGEPANPPPGPLGIRTGALARTVAATRARYLGNAFRMTVQAGGDAAPYARIHEFGGLAGRGHRSLIPPRPYLGPSIKDREPDLRTDLVAAVDRTKGEAGIG
jgi:hypothetical protein